MQQQAKPQSLGTGSTNDQGQEKVDVPAQQTKGEFTLPLLFGSLWVLKGFDAAPCTGRGGGVFFIQSADCSTALLWKCPHRRAQKECFSSHLGLPEPSQGDTGNSASQPSRKMAKPTTNPDVSLTVITPHSLSQRGFCRPGSNPPVGSKLP